MSKKDKQEKDRQADKGREREKRGTETGRGDNDKLKKIQRGGNKQTVRQ